MITISLNTWFISSEAQRSEESAMSMDYVLMNKQLLMTIASDTGKHGCANAQALLNYVEKIIFPEIIEPLFTAGGPLKKQEDKKQTKEEKQLQRLAENHNLINFPNPFSEYTTIEAYLPETTRQAEISVYNLLGIKIKKYKVNHGYNAITVFADDLPGAGVYFYELIDDHQVVGIRKMLLLR